MTKIIHCIKVGPNKDLGDFELSCIDSWKRTYPDFEIKYWNDGDIRPMLVDCRYAASCYNNRKYAFAMDYVKLKILYEHGGLYMDTDVFCVERVPDTCFEKTFFPWDPGFGTYWTQNGTCLYCEKGDEVVGKIIDLYKSLGEYPEVIMDNTVAEKVIRSYPLDWENKTNCQLTNQDIGPFRVYNCVQFGAFDYTRNLMWDANVPIYMVHARTKSWENYKDENVYLYYAFIDDNVDDVDLYWAIDAFCKMELGSLAGNAVLVLGMNTVSSKANWFSNKLNLELANQPKKSYLMAPLGNRLGYEELNAAFLDFVTKRFNKIKFCRDILDNFTGKMEV